MIPRSTAVAPLFVGLVAVMGFAPSGGAAAQTTCKQVPKTIPASRLLLSGSKRKQPFTMRRQPSPTAFSRASAARGWRPRLYEQSSTGYTSGWGWCRSPPPSTAPTGPLNESHSLPGSRRPNAGLARRSSGRSISSRDRGPRRSNRPVSATVPIGAIVYTEIIEPVKYGGASYPPGFPWLAATSPNHHVLTPVALCKQNGVSTLVLKVAAFRGTHAGVVRLTAPLAGRWRALKTGPRQYQATVTVR
jgi:hypothetical protein